MQEFGILGLATPCLLQESFSSWSWFLVLGSPGLTNENLGGRVVKGVCASFVDEQKQTLIIHYSRYSCTFISYLACVDVST